MSDALRHSASAMLAYSGDLDQALNMSDLHVLTAALSGSNDESEQNRTFLPGISSRYLFRAEAETYGSE